MENHNNEFYADEDVEYQGSNIAEEEMGQLQAIHNNMNHIMAVRRELEKQASKPSLEECENCGEEIPEQRRLAVPGCTLCIYCKAKAERR